MTDTYIARVMREKGITQKDLADKIGVTRQAVSLWQKSGRLSSSMLPTVAAALGVSVGQLVGDEDDANGARIVRVIRDAPLRDGYARIPILEAYGSCGCGATGQEADIIIGAVDMSKSFINTLPGVTSAGHLQIISSTGDSMAPTIESKALVVVDTAQSRIIGDGVYCLRRGDDIFIKRLMKNFDGSLTMISDNPLYPREVIARADLPDSAVIGRVVYSFNGRNI